MRTATEVAKWISIEEGKYQNYLELLTGDVFSKFDGTDKEVMENKKTINALIKLQPVLYKFDEYKNNGLPSDLDIGLLEELKDFCTSQKERFNKKIYEAVGKDNPFVDIIPSFESATLYQEAEIYIMILVALTKGGSF